MKKMIKKLRENGVRTKKDGTQTRLVAFDLPLEMSEKVVEISKKTGVSKNFLFVKALRLLFLEQQ